jgi:hypothetical protein
MSFPISSGGSAYPSAMSGGMGAGDVIGQVSNLMKGGKRRSRRSRSRRSRQRGGLSDTAAQSIGNSIVGALGQQKGGKRRSRKRTSRKRKYGGKRRSTKRRMSGGVIIL